MICFRAECHILLFLRGFLHLIDVILIVIICVQCWGLSLLLCSWPFLQSQASRDAAGSSEVSGVHFAVTGFPSLGMV